MPLEPGGEDRRCTRPWKGLRDQRRPSSPEEQSDVGDHHDEPCSLRHHPSTEDLAPEVVLTFTCVAITISSSTTCDVPTEYLHAPPKSMADGPPVPGPSALDTDPGSRRMPKGTDANVGGDSRRGVVSMQQRQVPSTATDDARRSDEAPRRSALPSPPGIPARSKTWTPGRVVALVIGCLLGLMGVGPRCRRNGPVGRPEPPGRGGYVTTGTHRFSTAGSALATDPIELGDPGISWLYSGIVLGEVRIHVSPEDPASSMFVAIGPTNDVDRYLSGVNRTVITDIWTDSLRSRTAVRPARLPATRTSGSRRPAEPAHRP